MRYGRNSDSRRSKKHVKFKHKRCQSPSTDYSSDEYSSPPRKGRIRAGGPGKGKNNNAPSVQDWKPPVSGVTSSDYSDDLEDGELPARNFTAMGRRENNPCTKQKVSHSTPAGETARPES